MTSTQSSQPSESHATAETTATISPLQTRIKWLELITQLLLLTAVGIFAFTTITALVRPAARHLLEPVAWKSRPVAHGSSEGTVRSDEPSDILDEMLSEPRGPRALPPVADEDEGVDEEKVQMRAAVVKSDSKLYAKFSEQSPEVGEVSMGETVFIMHQSAGWVLVLRGQGGAMGWMHKEDVSAR